jgi:hypothetical protein
MSFSQAGDDLRSESAQPLASFFAAFIFFLVILHLIFRMGHTLD